MKNSRFDLKSITIDARTSPQILHVLKPGKFVFSHLKKSSSNYDVQEDLYASNVSIHAIVGQNGAGKSSLLDLVYRVINNFSSLLTNHLYRTEYSMPLAYVKGVYVCIEYELDDWKCVLDCRGDSMALLVSNGKRYRVGDNSVCEWGNYEDVNKASVKKVREVTQYFFYTIVTNYAFNAFLSSDYSLDDATGLTSQSWIDGIFHKNDGYRTPLVLNPFRHNGQLDVQKETGLTTSRSVAILEFFKKRKWQFIDGYDLHDVNYHFKPHSFLENLRPVLLPENRKDIFFLKDQDPTGKTSKEIDDLIASSIYYCFRIPDSFASLLCEEYGVEPDTNDELQYLTCFYLVYKTFSIVSKYYQYSDFTDWGNVRYCFMSCDDKDYEFSKMQHLFKDIVSKINKDLSHITYKLRLTLNALRNQDVMIFMKQHQQSGFSFSEYLEHKCGTQIPDSVERIMETLPLPLFKPEIVLSKNCQLISMSLLSSGEKLFLYTMATLVYHIMNLKSVRSDYISYRHFNIIMDELEMCFHPEMQRCFVQKLVTTITRLHLNTHCNFNFILVTHSPFILSDIPKNNILFLQEGKEAYHQMDVNPFGTNINDVLVQNFFMGRQGFIGEFAKTKINDLVDFLKEGKSANSWNADKAFYFIDTIVGDGLIRDMLMTMFHLKFTDYETDFHN